MASNTPEAVIPRPSVLSPASPTELLTYVISHCRYPTTVIVGSSRQDFAAALSRDALPLVEPATGTERPQAEETQRPPKHLLLGQTLLQMAVSRHIRIVFTSSVTHFRAWTAVFSPNESKLTAPPAPQSSEGSILLAYGFIGLHRDTSEWSAQGLGTSAATLIEAAARHGFKAVIMEPKEEDRQEVVEEEAGPPLFGDEKVPLLKGIAMRDDGTWAGRTVELRRVLGRWFEFEHQEET